MCNEALGLLVRQGLTREIAFLHLFLWKTKHQYRHFIVYQKLTKVLPLC
jgi:hypothetical protein